ncbi:integrase arm-type DNA-binding domain-containing protein [Xenorhabdus sp. XENO-1]|uniref:tyrosine-type recombinase/integrase n=1 Tax=Xenorhabdus bovienii TaxID=40576 RepID=UPI0020CA935A|nr:site-specific integrase [Xenorhabdus bovienii]MCP9269050.1 integrase arm-type DNA-binding domain-containing protein [Xenorhabdus bovienii subsp. africana]
MAGTNKLSDKKLKALLGAERNAPAMFADGEGLSVKASKGGQLSWIFAYRHGGRGSRLERLTLGRYPDISLKVAREKREQCRRWLAEGFDPRTEFELGKEETLKPVTVEDALEYWLVHYARTRRTDEELTRAQLRKHIYPRLGHYPLARCETRHWVVCFDEISEKQPMTAGRMFQISKQALRFCKVRRYATSDALAILTIQDVGQPAGQRDRVLSDSELTDVWRCTYGNDQHPYYLRLLKILVLFGARTVEVRLSRWSEWDFESWIWTVPKEHSKTREKIVRSIPETIRPWLMELKKETGKSGLLLGEERTRASVSLKGRRLYKDFKHTEPWTLHDLRRTFSTGLNNIGIAPHIVELLLGHTLPGVMAIYNKSQYLPEKLDALNKWYERLDILVGNYENVVILKAAQ